MAYNIYGAIGLTGIAGSGALDTIDGSGLYDKDMAFVVVMNPTDPLLGYFYIYALDENSGLAESSPTIIAPNVNPGNKRWMLQLPYYTDPNFTSVDITTPLAVASGGTGVATLTDHGILLGSGTSAVTPLGAATAGQIPIGTSATTDPVLNEIDGTANQITVTNASGSITLSVPSGAIITFANTGVRILDTNSSNSLYLKAGSNLTSNHEFTITTGDAARTLTMSADLTVESTSTVNQDLTTDASPTFNRVYLTNQPVVSAGIATTYAPLLSGGTTIVSWPALANGQILVGVSGSYPQNATITPGTGIAVTNAAGSITIKLADVAAGNYRISQVQSGSYAVLGGTPTKVGEFIVGPAGVYRCRWEQFKDDSYGSGSYPISRIYVEDVGVGTIKYGTTGYGYESDDITVTAGQRIQVYGWCNYGPGQARFTTFHICAAAATIWPAINPTYI
jgi:hypothetical protein